MKIAVLGAGAWGTALANMLAGSGRDTVLWAREEEVVQEILEHRENRTFLPGVNLSDKLGVTSDPAEAFAGADVFLVVIPSQFLRVSLAGFREYMGENPVVVCASKGVELNTLSPMSDVVADALEGMNPRYAVMSGPSFAAEVSSGMPTSVALGCADKELGCTLRELFSNEFFRVYSTTDFRGVELGGAMKNVMAIATGMCDGLKFGHDARAAIITRGLAEMSRLGVAMGAEAKTFMGLSGMGDLVLTCTGDLSRNRQVGLKLGRGMKLDDIVSEMKAVAEGVKTTKALFDLAQKKGVDMPITEQVYKIIYQDMEPGEAVKELMGRELKEE